MIRIILAAVFLLAPPAARAQTYAGIVRAGDGDSFILDEQRIRLFGIDAPEYSQTCEVNYTAWTCGHDAASALRSIIDGRQVTCIVRDRDVYGRSVAKCLVDGRDAAAAMVVQGLAIVLDNGAEDYSALEIKARQAKRGIWGSKFIAPAEYRAAHSRDTQSPRPVSTSHWRAPVSSISHQYGSCAQARAAGVAPMRRGQATYNPNLDGDGDGIACEPYRGRR